MMSPIAICIITVIITGASEAQVRKCLEDSNCHSDECCAQSFYLFRCEKRGYNDGDRCGLCGCANGLSCVNEGINPFKVLSGRGHCRYRAAPAPYPVQPPKSHPTTLTTTSTSKPKPQVAQETKSPSTIKTKPVITSRDRFYQIFQPIYEQFIQMAAEVAGISLDDLDDPAPTTVTSRS
ncbi:hypothetical protein CHUAL_002331 [Chamberlinius hualienensis]